MTKKIIFLALCSLLLAPYFPVEAQQAKKVPLVGYLTATSSTDEAFRQGLSEIGYWEGKNIVVEWRFAEGKLDRLPDLAAELVRMKVNVIVVAGGNAASAAKKATNTIPIVIASASDPVGSGLVPSLAQPAGNLTGTSTMASDIIGKQLEVLTEAIPGVSRVALLWNPDNPGGAPQLREAAAAARTLGVRLQTLEARNSREIDTAFTAMTRERAAALVVLTDAIFTNQVKQIAERAAKRRLPSIYGQREYVEAGGLMVYSSNPFDLERRAATFVDKILKGAKPAGLPIEQPSKFDLVINLKTAKTLGLTIPSSLLLRADQVIE